MKHIERRISLRHAPRDFLRDLPPDNASTGLVAGLFDLGAGVIHISTAESRSRPDHRS